MKERLSEILRSGLAGLAGVAIFCVIFCLLCYWGLCALIGTLEDLDMYRTLPVDKDHWIQNNDVIADGYSTWKDVQLDSKHTIKIPEGWTLNVDENLSLFDEEGNQVAFGKRFDHILSEEEKLSFLSDHYGKTVKSYDALDYERIDGTQNSWLIAEYKLKSGIRKKILSVDFWFPSDDDSESSYYVLYFEYRSDDWHDFREEATAMIYSAEGG